MTGDAGEITIMRGSGIVNCFLKFGVFLAAGDKAVFGNDAFFRIERVTVPANRAGIGFLS